MQLGLRHSFTSLTASGAASEQTGLSLCLKAPRLYPSNIKLYTLNASYFRTLQSRDVRPINGGPVMGFYREKPLIWRNGNGNCPFPH